MNKKTSWVSQGVFLVKLVKIIYNDCYNRKVKEMSTDYIVSQVFVVISYLLLASTYLVKNRKLLLGLNVLSLFANAGGYYLLSAWSGLAMCGVALLRNVILIAQNHYDSENKNQIINWGIFVFLVAVSIVSAYFTYNGLLSLFSVFATFVYTVSIWQKNEIIYKALGIICSILWIIYNVFIWSILGFSCESVLLFVEIIGLILACVKLKKHISQKVNSSTAIDVLDYQKSVKKQEKK